jgi:hypothetical protein
MSEDFNESDYDNSFTLTSDGKDWVGQILSNMVKYS